MDSYPPPAEDVRLRPRWVKLGLELLIGLAIVAGAVAYLASLAPPMQFVCQYALDFHANRTVPSYVGRPLNEAMSERSYCVRPTHNDVTCAPREAIVVSQSIAGPQNPLLSTSELVFEARC